LRGGGRRSCRGFRGLLQRAHHFAGTPMANPFMSIAAKEDIELDRFGDSTGTPEV
jgi:hypothetical protein